LPQARGVDYHPGHVLAKLPGPDGHNVPGPGLILALHLPGQPGTRQVEEDSVDVPVAIERRAQLGRNDLCRQVERDDHGILVGRGGDLDAIQGDREEEAG